MSSNTDPAGTGPASGSWVIPAEASRVGELRSRVVSFATDHGVPDPPMADLRLAASEAITNAVIHGFRDHTTPGSVTATLEIDAASRSVTLVVSDDGSGMIARKDSPGLGLGLPLIAILASDSTIHSSPDGTGTQVTMTFHYDENTLPGRLRNAFAAADDPW